MNEHGFAKRVKALLEREGAFVFKVRGGGGQRSGIPDFYVAHETWTGWIELKYGGREVTPLQAHTMKQLDLRGVQCFTLRGPRWDLMDALGDHLGALDPDTPLLPQLLAQSDADWIRRTLK